MPLSPLSAVVRTLSRIIALPPWASRPCGIEHHPGPDDPTDGTRFPPPDDAAHHTAPPSGRLFLSLCLTGILGATHAYAQSSDDPSDATPGLAYTTNAGVSPALPSPCTSLNPASGDFTLSGSTVTPTTLVAPPVCGNYMDLPPDAPNPANDVWFRVDPPGAATYFRFTLFTGSAPALTNGAVALYEAPSAAGPFTLIGCAVGGSLNAGQPTVEANSFTPGNKLYLRVWDASIPANPIPPPSLPRNTSSARFKICVQGQTASTLASRGAAETPCAAPAISPSTTFTNIDYVFAGEEMPWLQADSAYVGGDLWVKLALPASGIVNMFLARGTASAAAIYNVGVSAYLTSDCTDPDKFRQVGAFTTALPTTAPTSTNFSIRCLPGSGDLYVRFHSLKSAQTTLRRFGQLRFRWAVGSSVDPTPPANNQPCGATPLAFNVSCPVAPGAVGNFNACNTPGIPMPSCGGFDGVSRDVWYSFVAPPSGTVRIEATAGSGFPADPAMALYTTGGNGCDGRFTLIQCDSRMGPGNSARIIRTGLVPGQTYYIRAWAEGSAAQGTFDICITEPVPPAGSCFYLIDLTTDSPSSTGTQYMDVTINGGTTTTYATAPGDLFEEFLISVPTGATVFFEYYNTNVSWKCTREVYRLGDPTPLWSTFSGGPVAGPTPPPEYTFTLNNACQPLVRPVSDCLGAKTVCAPNTVFGSVLGTLGPGNTYDLTAANMGCLGAENNGIVWLLFRPIQNGTVAFWFDGTTNNATADLDFAIWDAGLVTYMPSLPDVNADQICAPPGAPIRCNSARRNYSTGLMPGLQGVYQEGTGGWGWLSPLPVVADHIYLIALVKGSGTPPNVQYQMRWTLYADASGATDPNLMGCTQLVLPVEFLSIEAQARGPVIDVRWATASEKNSSHFIVERSADASTFTDIGQVSAAGNSQGRLDYLFTDEDPLPGANYYRLRQVDLDGGFEHSDIVVVMMDDDAGRPLLFPNPTTGEVELRMEIPDLGPVMVLITDAVGRALHTEFTTAAHGMLRYRLDAGPLAPGAYLVQVVTADGRSLGTTRLMKR